MILLMILFLIVLFFLFYYKFKIAVFYFRHHGKDYFTVWLHLWFFKVCLFEIKEAGKTKGIHPFRGWFGYLYEHYLKNHNQKTHQNVKHFFVFKFPIWLREREFTESMTRYMLEKKLISELYLTIDFSTGDASLTSVVFGMMNAVFGTFSTLFAREKYNRWQISINPYFSDMRLDLNVCCILDVKIGHIITTLFYYLKYKKNLTMR